MLNPVREGEEDYIEAIRYRRRLKIFENFLFNTRKKIMFTNLSFCVAQLQVNYKVLNLWNKMPDNDTKQ